MIKGKFGHWTRMDDNIELSLDDGRGSTANAATQAPLPHRQRLQQKYNPLLDYLTALRHRTGKLTTFRCLPTAFTLRIQDGAHHTQEDSDLLQEMVCSHGGSTWVTDTVVGQTILLFRARARAVSSRPPSSTSCSLRYCTITHQ